jgi:DNA topoisomerase-1
MERKTGDRYRGHRGVHYVTGRKRGITRRRCGAGFSYHAPSGDLIGEGPARERIVNLAIPPAWERVWICPQPQGHLQAYGYDARGRKQYIYHPLYRAMQDVAKFEHLAEFAQSLPRIRRKVRQHLSSRGLPREKVLAAIARLLDVSYIRIGNERYEKQNHSFGITTIRSKHLVIDRGKVSLRFRGKGGKEQIVEITDARVARILKHCDELPGRRLFQFHEDGERHSIDSGDVNDYLAEIGGGRFTAKDFRTWGGTIGAAQHLLKLGTAETELQIKRNIADAYREAAGVLGNTAAVCRKYYVHPAVILAYEQGSLAHKIAGAQSTRGAGLRKIERGVVAVLQHSSKEALRQWIADAEAA